MTVRRDVQRRGRSWRGSQVAIAAVLGVLVVAMTALTAQAATIAVTTTDDNNISPPGCSLRDAIQSAHFGVDFGTCTHTGTYNGVDTVTVPSGTHTLKRVGVDDINAVGDLDIGSGNNLTITGAGAATTIVDANGLVTGDRAFHIASGTTVTISGLTIKNGIAPVGSAGGGIRNDGTLTITNSTIRDNTGFDGGGVHVSSGAISTTITGSLFYNNISSGNGGGINSKSGTTTIVNSTFSANTAFNGGGVSAYGGTLNLSNSTLKGNAADATLGVGGNIGRLNPGATLNARANIFASGGTAGNCFSFPFTSRGSNLSDDNSCTSFLTTTGDQNNVASLSLSDLGDHGGPTQTLALVAGSTAIDAVQGACTSDGTAGGTPITTDQRGIARAKDGDGNGSTVCDAGAFERAPGTLQFSSPTYSVSESTSVAPITVTRTGGTDGSVTASMSLTNGTATAPTDYSAGFVGARFDDGVAGSVTLTVFIRADDLNEANETVNLALGSPTDGASIGAPATAVLTILDDDPTTPTIAINDVSVTEGDTGPNGVAFLVTLKPLGGSGQTVTVVAQTANGTATAGSDYTATGPTTLTFAPGVTAQTFIVPILGDTVFEANETFVVNLSSPTNATISDGQGVGTIVEDDPAPACGTRPPVGVTTARSGDGRLQVTVTAGTQAPNGTNRLVELQFQAGDNALVDVAGRSGQVGPFTEALTDRPTSVTFFVRRPTPGQPTTQKLTVVDDCGAWPTFVGGGTGAGF